MFQGLQIWARSQQFEFEGVKNLGGLDLCELGFTLKLLCRFRHCESEKNEQA